MKVARSHPDDGSITMLALGFTLLALMLTLVVVDASVVFLARRSLAAACDSAALAAAQQVDRDALMRSGVSAGPGYERSGAAVRDAVQRFQRDSYPATDFPGLRLTGSTDGRRVSVAGRRPVDLPFQGLLRSLGIGPVTVTASATAQLAQP